MSSISHEELVNEGLRRKYSFTVEKKHIDNKLEEALIAQQKNFVLSGFRKGKVPIAIVRQHKEKDLINRVVSDEIRTLSAKFFQEHKLVPINTPAITGIKFDDDLKYEIEIELSPEVPDVDLDSLDVKKESVEISDEDVKQYQDKLVGECFDLVETESGHKVEEQNLVYIDFVGKINDKVFEGGKGKDFMLTVGSNTVLPEVEESLVGHSVGDDITVDALFPDDYPMSALAKQKATFAIKVKKIMRKEPVTNRVKILKHFACKTEEEFITKAKKSLVDRSVSMVNLVAKKDVFEYLNNQFDFDLPPSTVKAEADKISTQIKDKSTLMQEAEKRVKLGFILMKIAQQQSINVTEDDISRAIVTKAQGDPKNMQYIVDLYKKNNQAAIALKGELLEEKVGQFIVDALSEKDKISIKELEDKVKTIEG